MSRDVKQCVLCGRYGPGLPLERHHLIPENRRASPVAMVCSPCHDQLHALFTNEELGESYDTVGKLQSAERMQDYFSWIRGTSKTSIDVETSQYVRERE